MLAEIHNKISQTGTNLSDRLEDKLTGDFFGTLRYLPFEVGWKTVFKTADITSPSWEDLIEKLKGYSIHTEFWYKDYVEGEIDLLVTSEEAVIGVEIKYLSGLSSEDEDECKDFTDSINQLARYSRMLDQISEGRQAYLLFLAPFKMMNTVKKSISNRTIISPNVTIGFLCWEDILQSLNTLSLSSLEPGQQVILKDLQALLIKKEFQRFSKFSITQSINNQYYKFHQNVKVEQNFSWPTRTIEEECFYVFKNQ